MMFTKDGKPLTDDQEWAIGRVTEWMVNAKGGDIFRLYGLAGCGKTTCSVALKDVPHPTFNRPIRVLFIAFTNRAVSILESKGCTPARTMHSVLYDVEEYSDEEKREVRLMKQAYLDAVLAGIPPEQRPPLPPSNKRVGFSLRDKDGLDEQVKDYDVVAVDECSMIGQRDGANLLLLNKPIIGIGDPGQLKPVGDSPFFKRANPDVLLTEVLRTDGDILHLAQHVREGGSFMNYGGSNNDFEIRRKALPEWFDYDQVICGIHDKRRAINEHVRGLRGYNSILPNEGEKLICVKNNKEEGMLNGTLWTVTRSIAEGDYAKMDLIEYAPRKDPTDLEIRFDVSTHLGCFQKDIKDDTEMGVTYHRDSVLMTWGNAITTHKAQGSEWNSVLVFDDGHIFRDQTNEWRYTAVTRAAKKLAVVSRH